MDSPRQARDNQEHGQRSVFRIAGFEYTSGVVNSIAYPGGRGFQQLYGYFEARIQPSSGEHNLGMCPAFWSEWLQSIVAFVVHEWTLSLRLDLTYW
jgi:hypothetical protein